LLQAYDGSFDESFLDSDDFELFADNTAIITTIASSIIIFDPRYTLCLAVLAPTLFRN
jgi:hypothetical protein